MTAMSNARIVGAYESPRRKAKGVHPFQVLQEVIQGALDDAGLGLVDVDGLCVTAGDLGEGGMIEDVIEVAEYLGIEPRYVNATDIGGCSAISQSAHAACAIDAGMADVVVVAYAACPRWFPYSASQAMSWPVGPGAVEAPFSVSPASAYAMFAQRHMHAFGTTPEQLAAVAVAIRANAMPNEQALCRDPISIEDVLNSGFISTPLHKLDCCVVTDSGGAVVLTRGDRARNCRKPPVSILGFGEAVSRLHLSQVRDFTTTSGMRTGSAAFRMAGLLPGDIDVAQLYDAFTITPLICLEDLGFCGKGEGGPFVADGNIGVRGSIPINTDGGGLSSNHPGKRGMFALIEGIRQLRGEGPGWQVPDCELSLVHGIGGFFSAAATMILSKD